MISSFFVIILLISLVANIILVYLIKQERKVGVINSQKNALINQQNKLEQKQRDYYNCLGKLSQITIETENLETFFQELISLVTEALNINFSYIFQLVNEENCLLLMGGVGWRRDEIKNYKISTNHYLFKEILAQDQPITIIYDVNLSEFTTHLTPEINLDLLNSGVNLMIKHPFKEKKITYIYGFYTEIKNSFTQLEIDFLSQLKEIIEQKLILNTKNKQFQFLQRSINSSTNGIVITSSTKDRPIVYVNKGFEKITGYSAQEVIGKNCRFLQGEEKEQEGVKKIRLALNNNQEIRTVVKNFRKNGDLFWNEIYISPIYDDEGNITNYIGIQNDITNKYQTEQELADKTQQLRTFSNKLQKINHFKYINHDNRQQVFDYYIQKTCEILQMQVGLICELRGDQFNTVSSYHINQDQELITETDYFVDILSHKVLQENQSLVYEHLKTFDFFKNYTLITDLNVVSYLATPIIVNEDIYGVIHLFGSEKIDLDYVYQQNLIEAISQSLSRVIMAQEAELEKEQINIALHESQERLDNVFSSLEDVIWSIHPKTFQLMFINKSAERLYECKLNIFFQVKCFWLNFVDEKQREYVKTKYAELLNVSLLNNQDKSHDLEYQIILANGQKKYIRDRAYVIEDSEGNLVRIDGIITDITSRKITQLALEKSEQEFRILFDSAPIGMIITDIEGKILQVNHSLCELLGYEKLELINHSEDIIYHPEDRFKNKILYDRIITENIEQWEKEIRYITKNKNIVFTINHLTILRNNEGQVTQLIQQIVDISQIKAMEEQILDDAHYDKLTGLANRFLFVDRLKQTLKRSQKDNQELFAVLVIDIDNFKHINDSMGHGIGDQLLNIIAEKITDCVGEQDTVARISGDQFCILLDDLKSQEDVIIIANNILDSCHTDNKIQGYQFFSSVSIGITYSLIGYEQPEEMIRDADLTMHKAKQDGKNCYRIFNPQMHTQLLKKIQLENCLRKAVNDLEFELYYQPIINVKTNIIAGFEALIRWHSPELGFVSPAQFIPLAEETNLIIPLGDWILDTAVKQLVKWQQKYPQLSPSIAVNLSSKQLSDPNFLTRIDSILVNYDFNPQLLKMEMTETILMENFSHAQEVLKQLQHRKLRISLDDFGTGYSSLSYLHQLPFNTLKIDRSFVSSVDKKKDLHSIIKTIITLAHNLGLDVIAEGIETPIQAEILSELNCDYLQGYMYSKPVNAEDAEKFMQQFIKDQKDGSKGQS